MKITLQDSSLQILPTFNGNRYEVIIVEDSDTDKSLFDGSIVRALVDIYRIITEGQTFDRGNQMFLFVTCLSQRFDKGTEHLLAVTLQRKTPPNARAKFG